MTNSRLILYFRKPLLKHKFLPGDRYFFSIIKRLFFKKKIGGVEKVFLNLCKGLDLLGIKYYINIPFNKLNDADRVIVLGTGKYSLSGYNKSNPVVAGIALMTHPSEWPDLLKQYPVVKYLQHSTWASNVYKPFYGNTVCGEWPAGIETDKWKPENNKKTDFDILIYNKIRWNKTRYEVELINPIINRLKEKRLTYREVIYGNYQENEYYTALKTCKAMIFLCEHESQGFACCEALSMDVPVFAWDQGFCLDPNRFTWNDPVIPATSVPFFDERCGMKFKDMDEFNLYFNEFLELLNTGSFSPRQYILENLTMEKSAQRMLEIVKSVC